MKALIQELKSAKDVAGLAEIHTTATPVFEPLAVWDEIANEPVPGGPNPLSDVIEEPAPFGPIQIENQIIPLPSNGNIGPEYTNLEIYHRISHADHHLNRIRDLIAEKSFQFSHVIRVAPRKAVNTRSRAEVKKLNLQISVHCRLYTQCRARLIKLGAILETDDRFQILTVEDIKASTAIINPNEQGSTQVKLSWIWQSSGGHRWGLASGFDPPAAGTTAGTMANVIECKLLYSIINIQYSLFKVRRVHWLRARAQLMRWQEEVTLTGYEMQWTVRHFLFMSRKWALPSGPSSKAQGSSSGTGTGLTAGAIAYWNRKRAVWLQLTFKADNTFKVWNPAYDSPLQ